MCRLRCEVRLDALRQAKLVRSAEMATSSASGIAYNAGLLHLYAAEEKRVTHIQQLLRQHFWSELRVAEPVSSENLPNAWAEPEDEAEGGDEEEAAVLNEDERDE